MNRRLSRFKAVLLAAALALVPSIAAFAALPTVEELRQARMPITMTREEYNNAIEKTFKGGRRLGLVIGGGIAVITAAILGTLLVSKNGTLKKKEVEIERLQTILTANSQGSAPVTYAVSPAQAAQTAARFCAKCGAAVREGAAFCGECGAKTEH
jgi:hypothetical protein